MNIFEQSTEFRLKGFPRKTDQGERGTCAAFSTVAMLEYYLDFKEKLSPQHLYASCHLENNDEGSDLSEIFRCAKEFGVCRYAEWPYNKNRGGNENQVVNPEVLKNIAAIRFDDIDFQFFKTDPPQGIDEYKSVLSGADGKRPSPVVVGCQVFSSSFADPGWVKLPASPMESDNGYHAMLIYGWKDTPGLDSKGYFFAQNSWGNNNDVKIPFEYIEKYAMKAGRFVAEAKTVPEPEKAAETETEEKAPAAAPAVNDKKDMTLPPKVTAVKNEFFTSQKKNMLDGKYSYPGIKLPFPQKLGAFWNVNTSCFEQAENFRNPDGFRKYLEQQGIHHLYSEVKIFRIQIKNKYYYHLISAFLYRYDGKETDMNDIELLQRYYQDVYSKSSRTRACYTIFTIGTAGEFASGCSTSCDPALFLCEPGKDDGVWLFHLPQAECGWITQEFFAHLLPGQYYKAVKNKLDNWIDTGVINIKNIKKALGATGEKELYDRQIESALNDIFNSGEYAKNKEGNIIPPTWNLPAGYKKTKRYGNPSKRLFLELLLWYFITVLLVILVTLVLRKEIGLLLGVVSAVVNHKRNQALQSFRYERIK